MEPGKNLLRGQDELACGVSAVGYGFVTGGLLNLRGLWRAYSRKKRVLYLGLSGIALVMLLPAITGWISTCLHLSGILSGLIVHFTGGVFPGRLDKTGVLVYDGQVS